MPSANASALHLIMSLSYNAYSVEKRNTITLIPSKNASSQHLFHRKAQHIFEHSVEKCYHGCGGQMYGKNRI